MARRKDGMNEVPLSERSKRNGVQWVMACGCGNDEVEARRMEELFNDGVEEEIAKIAKNGK